MKKIIFLLFALALNTNANLTATATFESRLTLQEQTFNAKIELQDQAIQNLKDKFEETNKYKDLRKDVLDSQENTIGWWLSVFAIFLALFGIFGFFVAKDKIQEFERLNKEAKNELEKIKQHTKTAEQDAADITKLKKETLDLLANPEEPLSLQVSAEVEQSGSKLEKQILIARKLQKDNKIEQAITLWQEIVTIAKYENNKEQQANGYFYLGYLYGDLDGEDNLQKAIAACQKAIEIKPNYDDAYYNMGLAYYYLGGKDNLQKAIAAYQKAIKIKPDYYKAYYNIGIAYDDLGGKDNLQKAIATYQKAIKIKPNYDNAYYNMGNAYRKLGQYKEAINAYEQAIKINPEIVKHSKKANWDELNTWIEALDESATKQKYQAILRKLKGE